eukprot:Gregarina_sp_Pseudo_9__4247@NODE_43_length_5170_cov_129_922042_g40_i0_p2_GENE_NODE_43_length_5170_cov_129_922042_g40_i0NODE_43_length_5170_cov_129_922042_g40_i0_p2_ORF_typecomplete_len497_score136_01Baculo_IE1/PF05290_11/0_024GrpE/PF01025_19/0_41zf4CXXC_R1/PF10497_9/7_5_NODE_43_length_5170_cov_129_922042_g40_i022513741
MMSVTCEGGDTLRLGVEQLPEHLEHGRRKLKALIFSSHSSKKTALKSVDTECAEAVVREVIVVLKDEALRLAKFKRDFMASWGGILDATAVLLQEDPDVLNYLSRGAKVADRSITAADVELSILRSLGGKSLGKSLDSATSSVGFTEDLSSLLFTDSQRTRASASLARRTSEDPLATGCPKSDPFFPKLSTQIATKESQWLPLAEALTILSSCVRGSLKGFLLTSMEVIKFRYSIQKFRRATEDTAGKMQQQISSEFTASVLTLLHNLDSLLQNEIWEALAAFARSFAQLMDAESMRQVFEISALSMGHLAAAANVAHDVSDDAADLHTVIHLETEVITRELWDIANEFICHQCNSQIGSFALRCCNAKLCVVCFHKLLAFAHDHDFALPSCLFCRCEIKCSARSFAVAQIAARIARAGLSQAQLQRSNSERYKGVLRDPPSPAASAPEERIALLKSYFTLESDYRFIHPSLLLGGGDDENASTNIVASVLEKALQ